MISSKIMLMLSFWSRDKYFWKFKDVLYHVSVDLGEVNIFSSSSSEEGEKAPLPFKSSKNPA